MKNSAIILLVMGIAGAAWLLLRPREEATNTPSTVAYVEGQVFLTADSGASIKQAAVTVWLVPKDAADKVIAAATERSLEMLTSYDEVVGRHSAARIEALRLIAAAKDADERQSAQMLLKLGDETYANALEGRQSLVEAIIDEVFATAPVRVSARTDADGKFGVMNDKIHGRYYVWCRISRSLAGKTQSFSWLLEPSASGDPLFLSNDNVYVLRTPRGLTRRQSQRRELSRRVRPKVN